MKNDNSN